MDRRDFLNKFGIALGVATIAPAVLVNEDFGNPYEFTIGHLDFDDPHDHYFVQINAGGRDFLEIYEEVKAILRKSSEKPVGIKMKEFERLPFQV